MNTKQMALAECLESWSNHPILKPTHLKGFSNHGDPIWGFGEIPPDALSRKQYESYQIAQQCVSSCHGV